MLLSRPLAHPVSRFAALLALAILIAIALFASAARLAAARPASSATHVRHTTYARPRHTTYARPRHTTYARPRHAHGNALARRRAARKFSHKLARRRKHPVTKQPTVASTTRTSPTRQKTRPSTGTPSELSPIPTPPPPVEGTALWSGSFESGTIDKALYPYSSFVAGHVNVVSDPLGSGQKVLEYAIADSDRPYSEATNPRGDVESPRFFKPGDEVYIGIPILFPNVPTGSGWFQVAELYGAPYNGSPSVGLDLNGSGHLQFRRDINHGYDAPWTAPTALDDKWHTVIFHVRFATDNTGFVEVWYDGVQQKLTNGSTRINFATLDAGINWNGEPNFLNINNYRQAGAYPGTVTLFHGAPVVATSLAAAQSKLTL